MKSAMDTQELRIRQARPEDRDALRRMQAFSLRELGSRYYSRRQIEAFLTCVGTMDDFVIDEGTYYLVEAEHGIAASGGWSRRRPNHANVPGMSVLGDPDVATVRSIFVHPAFARRGLGRMLMNRIEDEVQVAGYAEVELTATLSGEPLCVALGYEERGRIALDLPGGMTFPGIVMGKRLVPMASASPADIVHEGIAAISG